MSTDSKTYSAAALYTTLIVGAACGAVIYYFLKPDPCKGCNDDAPKPIPVVMTGFFDRTSVSEMTGTAEAWGVRFYLSKRDDGALSVLAGPIKEDGAHTTDASGTLQFRVYKGISGDRTDMTLLSEDRAEAAVKAASTSDMPTWSMDVKTTMIERLLVVDGAMGLGLQGRPTAAGDWSFDLAPVKFDSDAAYSVGAPADVLLGAYPCPMHCPKEPALYLHQR
ncbi:MAG TPA: hypothetical protein PKY96_10095 [Flavobacteriales bacterium]|nr:hypothetical protein [Flavobacteriales bacterium]